MAVDDRLYDKIEESVRTEINPRDSWRASRAFRLQIGGEIAARALRRTVELAGGDRI
jgi:xanthine dehydrogenase FAD-binding subunit